MRINPEEFFKFCLKQVPLLRSLADRSGEGDLSESEIHDFVVRHSAEFQEQPSFVTKELKRLGILVPLEQDGEFYLMAEPVTKLLHYLLATAKPVSSRTVQGHIDFLQDLCQRLRNSLEIEDAIIIELALTDVTGELRRLHDAIGATNSSVLQEVARFKTDKRPATVREKFLRILWWMENYVAPMVDIIRVDAPMQATFAELEQLLRQTGERVFSIDPSVVERNLRLVKSVRAYALRIFDQCWAEIYPLYKSLARSNSLAIGAAFALERLRQDGPEQWGRLAVAGVFTLRYQSAPSDLAIVTALERVVENPPQAAPVVNLQSASEESPAMQQRRWLSTLPNVIAAELPIEDLLFWLITRRPDIITADVLTAFSVLLFHKNFRRVFTGGLIREYETRDRVLRASPVRLEARNK